MDMRISFPGGKRVDAHFLGQVIRTDQPKAAGGDDSAPEPYVTFLASIGTCAGIYVLGFCRARNLPVDQVSIIQHHEFDPKTHRLNKVTLEIEVPDSFPAKYRKAIRRSADRCAVKRTIQEPPEFDIVTTTVASNAQVADAT